MKKYVHYIPVILGVVMVVGALFLTGGFFAAPPAVFKDDTQVTTTTEPIASTLRDVTESSTTPMPETVTSSVESVVTTEGSDRDQSVTSGATPRSTASTDPKATTTTSSTTTTKSTTRNQAPYAPYTGGAFFQADCFPRYSAHRFLQDGSCDRCRYPRVRCQMFDRKARFSYSCHAG